MRLGDHTISIVRPGSRPADYGTGTELDWATATTSEVSGCSVQPAPSEDFTIDRDTFTTRWVAYLPKDTDVHAHDRVQWEGDTYEIDGGVLRWHFGALSHVVVNLRRSEDG
jgi:hypothetical protein